MAVRQDELGSAILYVRVSTKEQGSKALTLENQEATVRDFCASVKFPVIDRFLDQHSGRNAIDRPEFQRLLAYCRSNRGKVAYVVVYDLSRFARQVRDQAAAINELERCGVRLRSVNERNVDETAAGRLQANIFGAVAQNFSDALSEKMTVRMRQSAAAGRFPWKAPVGYMNVGGKEGPNIVVDPQRGPLVRRAFELIRTGRFRASDVLEIVIKEGLTTMKGKPVPMQTFHVMLRNPLYAGWVTMPSDETFEPVRGLHAPIITPELFDEVQMILEGRTPVSSPKQKVNPQFPLKCFVRCEACGKPLTGGVCRGKTKTYRRYWCYRPACRAVSLQSEVLEDRFVSLLRRLRPAPGDETDIRKEALALLAKQGNPEDDARRLGAAIEKLKSDKKKLVRLLMDGSIDQATYQESVNETGEGIASAEEELRNLRTQDDEQGEFLRFVEEFQSIDMAQAWHQANPEQKQRVQTFLFSEGLSYSQESGTLNTSNACLFSALEVLLVQNINLASPTGFEPVLSP